jgi:hypothetical protein
MESFGEELTINQKMPMEKSGASSSMNLSLNVSKTNGK